MQTSGSTIISQINTAFCYIQLKCSKRVPHIPTPICTKFLPIVAARHIWLAPGSRHIMPISVRLMFVSGGRLARRLDGRGRLSAGSQRILTVVFSLSCSLWLS